MTKFEVDDMVVYAPHGAGVVVARESRGDDFGEYLSIRIAHSKMTMLVPADAADDKGVRPVMSAKQADALLKSLADVEESADPAPRTPPPRGSVDHALAGQPEQVASVLRTLNTREARGKKLTHTDRKLQATAKLMLVSEIALVKDIDVGAAEELVDKALAKIEAPAAE